MLGAKGGMNQVLERLPPFSPCREFQFPPRVHGCSACLCPASGPLGRGRGKIGSNCSGFKDGFGAMRQSVNHSDLLKTSRAVAVFSRCFVVPQNRQPNSSREQEIAYLMSLEMETLNAEEPSVIAAMSTRIDGKHFSMRIQ